MLKTLKKLNDMKKENANEHLIYLLEKTTPYQRMVWLGKMVEFWKKINNGKKMSSRGRRIRGGDTTF